MQRVVLTILLAFTCFVGFSQYLEKIGKKGAVSVSGGLQSNFVVNSVVNQPMHRDPFSWVLSGNVSINLIGVSLPFSFSFSNRGNNYSQPFNMTAIHPKYKNWQAHLGITSMNFSPYTYQGMNFLGGGLEYKPKKWFIKAFGGRLQKAIEYNPEIDNRMTVAYQRLGFGVSSGWRGKKIQTELIIFKGQDDPNSLKFINPNVDLTPKDNIVVSLSLKATVLKALKFQGEIAASLLTDNVVNSPASIQKTGFSKIVRGNESTSLNFASNASLDYRIKSFGIGAKYERIDPNYGTLGAVYFNNDLQNITLNTSFSVFENKLNINLSGGFQHNNLRDQNASNDKRWIGTASLTAQPFKGFSINANYSNMSSFSKRNPAADPFYDPIGDTLNFYQVSQSTAISLMYAFGKEKEARHSLGLSGNYSRSENITGRLENAAAFGFNVQEEGQTGPVDMYNAMFNHSIQLPSKWQIAWTANFNHSILQNGNSTFFGPGINTSKSFLKNKLSMNVGATYNQQFQLGTLANHVMNFRGGLRYNPEWWDKKFGKLGMAFNANYTNRLSVQDSPNIQNITVLFNLSYQFSK